MTEHIKLWQGTRSLVLEAIIHPCQSSRISGAEEFMPYLIDGHNLIPQIPGLRLQDPEDERALIETLQAFCGRVNRRAEVFFDNASPGQARRQKFGRVTAHFVQRGSTADAAISARLRKLGREAPNWTVVSSDNEVRTAARAVQAKTESSAEFANQLMAAPEKGDDPDNPEAGLSDAEVAAWLRIFNEPEEE